MSDEELRAQAEVDRMADKGDFAKLYAHFQGDIERAKREKGESTAGEWIHYPSGSDAKTLCKTLEGKGTEWCTAGVDVAKNQLKSGEFYIYYTYDQDKKPADPRIAVYLIDGQISEVRGVYGKDQDLELDFVDIAREKYKDFPGSENYEKKDRDMKALTAIETKNKTGQELDKNDLVFLYEINSKIEGFGHGADPRVAEIRNQRNSETDAPIVFDCDPSQIARTPEQVDQNTKAYIGPLVPGVFQQLVNLEHVYTSFPEGKISRSEVMVGGLDKDQLQLKLNKVCKRANGETNISSYAQDMLDKMYQSEEFKKFAQNPENIQTVRLKVGDLGFASNPTTDQIYAKAQELGLELCPAEVGPYQRLKEIDQPMGDWYRIAMKQITDRDGRSCVFGLEHRGSGLWLYRIWARPTSEWDLDRELMFRLRQVSEESSVD
jgi:hypothetical protein